MSTIKDKQLTMGVDVGSASVKVAIVTSQAGDHGEILATCSQRIRRRELHEVVQAVVDEALKAAGVTLKMVDYVATTGEADAVEFRTGHFYSITTHARGGVFLVPEAGGVLDVGALHARALKADHRGKVLAHRMTSQCASGSGQFIENIARYLGVSHEDVGPLSAAAKNPEQVSGICAVLAETDVINMVSRGVSTGDILKGIHLSIAGRLVQLVRAIGAEGKVVLTGGLSKDEGLLLALKELVSGGGGKRKSSLKVMTADFVTHPLAMYAGALGAALLGAHRWEQLRAQGRLETLAAAASA